MTEFQKKVLLWAMSDCESDENKKEVGGGFPYRIGKMYFIRTVTMNVCGRLKSVCEKELVLEDAAWVPDSGRFADALTDPDVLAEVEPFPDGQVIVGRGAIVDACIPTWKHLPRTQK